MSTIRRRFLRPWLILPLAALLGVGAWFAFLRPDDSGTVNAVGVTETTLEVTKGGMEQSVSATGSIEALNTEDLSFSSGGTVTAVYVKAGQQVKKGDVLATIDSADLESSVASAQAAVDDAEAKLSDDQDADASDAQLEADQANLDAANAQLESAREALDGAALEAPINGTVSAVGYSVGEELGSSGTGGTGQTGSGSGSGQSGADLGSGSSTGIPNASSNNSSSSTSSGISVISTGIYKITVNLDSTDVKSVAVGQTATITPTTSSSSTGFGGFPGGAAFPGGFSFPGGAANPSAGNGATAATTTPEATATADDATGLVTSVSSIATASSGVATFPVEIVVGGNPEGFNAGADAEVHIISNELKDVVQVSSLAITTTDTGSTVTVRTNGKDETRTVVTGITANGSTQITSGLQAGETVVLSLPGRFGGGPGGPGGSGDAPQLPGGGAAPQGQRQGG